MQTPKVFTVIPSTGRSTLAQAVASVKQQTYHTECVVVVDGPQAEPAVREQLQGVDGITVFTLPWNTGGGGRNGQFVYASAGMWIPADYICYLDEDNWFEPQHVQDCMTVIGRGVKWCYSLRQIASPSGEVLGPDDCESLGRWPIYFSTAKQQHHMVDTSCYCVPRDVAQQASASWVQLWGEDRKFYTAVSQNWRSFACTGFSTVNYRLGGNAQSVNWDFFQNGNKLQQEKYPHGFPWRKSRTQ
jgi:glycosyltransferase involved in cell wall biosynthesis